MTKKKAKEIANTVNSFDLEQLRENILNSSYQNDPCVFENTRRRLRDNKKEFILKSIFALSLGACGIGLTLINAITISFSLIKSIFGLIGGLCFICAGIINLFIAKVSRENLKHKLSVLTKNTNLSEEEVIAILKSDRFNELIIDNQVNSNENQMPYEIQEELTKHQTTTNPMQSKISPNESNTPKSIKEPLFKRIINKIRNPNTTATNEATSKQELNEDQTEYAISDQSDKSNDNL